MSHVSIRITLVALVLLLLSVEGTAQYKNRIYEPEFKIGAYYFPLPFLNDSLQIDFGTASHTKLYMPGFL